ncbi:MAG: O-antigen ligase family protein [Candidatus Magasanikbacteria bacterium]|nr:O-antigen ligase family protein [Candidatus Magasanikbacteria bacterium]
MTILKILFPMFSTYPTYLLLLDYALLRVFSFYFQPGSWINAVLTVFFLSITLALLIARRKEGWYLIAFEIILGGAGGFLSAFSLSLRTLLLISSGIIFIVQKIRNKELIPLLKENKIISIIFGSLILFAGISAIIGFLNGHALNLIFADALPYFFLFYYFPLKELLSDNEFIDFAKKMILAAIIGNAIFIFITFFGYSSGILVMFDPYYHWYRDIGLGKITEMGGNFYRLVLNEQLLLAPILLYWFYKTIKEKTTCQNITILSALLFVLGINFTRIYHLAIIFGCLFLINKINWKKAFSIYLLSTFIYLAIFCSTNLIITQGKDTGLNLLLGRAQSIVNPDSENSSLSRMMLLPKIWEKIKTSPIIGNGLGDGLTVYSPVFKKEITTPHYDWGYLEIIGEMGILGFLIWLSLIWMLFKQTKNNRLSLALLISLLIINITSPALFHILGIILITFLLLNKKITDK